MASGALAGLVTAPTVAGPVTLAAGGCHPSYGCGYDYVLAPSATADPTDSWHALWLETALTKEQSGWCDIDSIANFTWGGGALPVATYPHSGSMIVTGRETATLPLDAGGKASTPGRLTGAGMPAGMITTWVERGHMVSLWQGRATVDPTLVMAAELDNPTDPAPPSSGRSNDYAIGLPCADFAAPGNTFTARFAHPAIHAGQTAYLELRIPQTGLRWILTPTRDEQTAVDGKATVQMAGGLGGVQTRTKPQVLRFADRWTYQTTPGFGNWTAIVTLQGPTGTRHYRIPLTVKA
jgi:hypothetical protein